MLTVEQANADAVNRGLSSAPYFSSTRSQVRQLDLNTIQSGDVITMPTAGYTVYSQTLRNGGVMEFINVNCERNGASVGAVRFTPSLLQRVLQLADSNDQPSGQYVHSTGTAVADMQRFQTVDSWLATVPGRRIRVTLTPQRVMAYKAPESTDPDKAINGFIPVCDFV